MAVGDIIRVEKRETGRNIIFPIKLRLLGRILSRKRERGRKFWGRKSRLKIMEAGKNIKF